MAAAHRSMVSEIAVRNGLQVCGSFFDMAKFFDTVQAQPLFGAFVETGFPLVDAVMGLQVHMAPRVILINTVPSAPIVVDSSI